MKLNIDFELPKPTIKKRYEWKPVVRLGRRVPWGYEQDPDDENVLLPIESQLELLEEGKKALKKYSYREVANWLSVQTGRYISHAGLASRIKVERKRANNAASYRRFEEKARKAAEKAKSLEKRIGGASARVQTGDED